MTDVRVGREAVKVVTRPNTPAPVASGRTAIKVLTATSGSAPVAAGRVGLKVLLRRPQFTWWDGANQQQAVLLGWWDGAKVQPLNWSGPTT